MNATKTRWQDLLCLDGDDSDRAHIQTLGQLVKDADKRLDTIRVDGKGRISEWDGMFVYAEGEEPSWDTPRCDVDWTGFDEARYEARAV